eukprot:TRINITY_DN560_c0_g1_i1.p1 TRINITY_DN560_c0_g1~~TRINITY_DN560_c0_g1_i1.p1  ORF type:complete len:914 (-),score=67.53 TRINITY_DN560_c0_g1_i1:1166-3907(-)
MDVPGSKTRSIFDIIEEKKENPEEFIWSKNPSFFCNDPVEFIHDGTLTTIKPNKVLKPQRYVLTLKGLIKYKVQFFFLPLKQAKDKTVPTGYLKLDNPRLEKTEDRALNMCGFKISGYKASYKFFCKNIEDQDEWVEKLRKVCVSSNISYRYRFKNMLGKGNFAKVHLAQRKRDDESFAIKTIEKTKILENPRNMVSMHREILILRKVDHPNVIKLYEVYENELYVHLVLEYLKGGELFQKLQSKGVYSEKDASLAIKCVLQALDYCHTQNIVHRDLKPENLILAYFQVFTANYSDSISDAELKIADFGLATIVDPNVPEKLRCGSPGYVAPEVLNNLGYGTKADIFSAGIILCVILTGVSPFHGKSYQDVLLKNKEGAVSLTQSHWTFVSKEAKDLVSKMVAKDPKDRCTASEALKHSWFHLEHTSSTLLSNAQENMKKYHNKQNENRFNVSKIKPEFSMVTCTPLLNSRFTGKDSPLIVPRNGSREGLAGQSPALLPRRPEEKKPEVKAPVVIRTIYDKFKQVQASKKPPSSFTNKNFWTNATADDESADFNENEMDEKSNETKTAVNVKPLHRTFMPSNFLARKLPPTPGFTEKKSLSYLKSIATPMQNRRWFKANAIGEGKGQYLQKIADVRINEESKRVAGLPKNDDARKSPMKSTFHDSTDSSPSPSKIINTSLVRPIPPHALNELARGPPSMIPEVSNSSGTEVPLEKFETALSHKSPSAISSSEGATEREQRKDTPRFSPGLAQRIGRAAAAIVLPKKAGTQPINPTAKVPENIRKIDSVKQRIAEDIKGQVIINIGVIIYHRLLCCYYCQRAQYRICYIALIAQSYLSVTYALNSVSAALNTIPSINSQYSSANSHVPFVLGLVPSPSYITQFGSSYTILLTFPINFLIPALVPRKSPRRKMQN